jgi:hypothetical protein
MWLRNWSANNYSLGLAALARLLPLFKWAWDENGTAKSNNRRIVKYENSPTDHLSQHGAVGGD